MNQHAEITLGDAERMLSFVAGVHDRDVWVKMAYALRQQFGDDAFDIWDQWSARAENYNPKRAAEVWKSCKLGGGKTATIASLVKFAKDGGWTRDTSSSKQIDPEEQRQARIRRDQRVEAERIATEKLRADAAAEAADLWARATEAPASHPYLQRKLIDPAGTRVLDRAEIRSETDGQITTKTVRNVLLVPLRHGPGALVGLQLIHPDGGKFFILGTPSAGAYYVVGKPTKPGPIVICEGYATAVSIHMATGYCTVVAISAGQLLNVARKIRKALPQASIIMAADDDAYTKGNPGMTAATIAAADINGYVAAPVWSERAEGRTDFNDLHADEGLDAVAACINRTTEPPTGRKQEDEPDRVLVETPNNAGSEDAATPFSVGNAVNGAADRHDSPVGTGADQPPDDSGAYDGYGVVIDADEFIYPTTPMDTAEKFQRSLPEDGKVLFWRGEFYTWDGCRYAVRDAVYLHQQLYHFMAARQTKKYNASLKATEVIAFSPKKSHIEDVMHALRAVCFVDLPEPPSWIEARPGDVPASEIIAFRNGFLHWPTRKLRRSDPRLFITSALEFDFNPRAPAPQHWLAFMSSLWPSDPESIECLADMFGYLLTDDTSLQKAFMMIGPPRCGKGTILRVLEMLIGQTNRASPSLALLGTQFGLQALIGKRIAIISDARLSGKADQQPIVENILRITGEDSLTFDRKNLGHWSGKLSSRFVFAANETPPFTDASSALSNRFMLFKFTKSFLNEEDHGLTARLLLELPSILLWALEGLQRLKQRGYLVQPKAAKDIADELREQGSPIGSFVADRCILSPVASVDRGELFSAWREWCGVQGMDHPGTVIAFGRKLSAAASGIGRSQPVDGGARLNLYTGIRLRSAQDVMNANPVRRGAQDDFHGFDDDRPF